MPGDLHPFFLHPSWPSGLHLRTLAILAENRLNSPFQGFDQNAEPGLSALFWGLAFIITVPLVIFLSLKIVRFIRSRREKEFIQQMKEQAQRHEKAREYVSAAVVYEKLKDPQKAAGLFEQGGDFTKAASIHEYLGDMIKAREMYERAGDSGKAAELCMAGGDFVGAARIYHQRGEKLKSAEALEMTGNRLAAVRAYREANNYEKAAALLREEGMYREAAEMFGISLSGEKIDQANARRFYSYASLLETAGERGKAGEVYRKIAVMDPDYRDVLAKAAALSPQQEGPAGAGEPSDVAPKMPQAASLKSLISPRIEPRYAFRLWVQVLKSLDQMTKQGLIIDNLSPESVRIDSANRVTFSSDIPKNFAYIAPEIVAGAPQDQLALVYSMGVILYEMLTGDLDSFALKKPGEVKSDIPPWLEELAVQCIERDRAARYQSFQEIFSALLTLKNRA
jgi:tetratricopeptide (TPR) repeat protein